MSQARDDWIANSPLFAGKKWEDLEMHHLHMICKKAIDHCIVTNERFGYRFNHFKTTLPLDQMDERLWLVDLFDSWFMRKWNEKRRQMTKGPRKRAGGVMANCVRCGEDLRCFNCAGIDVEVRAISEYSNL